MHEGFIFVLLIFRNEPTVIPDFIDLYKRFTKFTNFSDVEVQRTLIYLRNKELKNEEHKKSFTVYRYSDAPEWFKSYYLHFGHHIRANQNLL